MKRLVLIQIIMFVFLAACVANTPQEVPPVVEGVYQLVTLNGRVVTYTEFQPSPGDVYWDATKDIWYEVVSVREETGWVVPQTEASRYYFQRNIRYLVSGLIVLLLASVVLRLVRRQLR